MDRPQNPSNPTMPVTIQPIDLLAGKTTVPSELRSAEWSRLPQWMREESFWMAGVARHEIAQEMRDIVGRSGAGEAGEFELYRQWEEALARLGYAPEPGQEGTVKDLRSIRRFAVALRTNRALMNGWARRENGLRPGPLKASPCYELVRFQEAEVPREWVERFLAAGGELFDGRMIAAKTSPVWEMLGSVELFNDSLGVDHPPFAWGSGMGWGLVGSTEAMALGVMTARQIREQAESAVVAVTSPGTTLQARPQVTAPDLRDSLASELAGLAEWRGDTLIYTDPNGSRPVAVEELETLWSRPLPETFHDAARDGLFQRQSVIDFADDPEGFARRPERDQWDDLARAVGRVSDAAVRRRTMRRIAEREDLSWIDALLSSPLWRAAVAIGEIAPRAAGIVRAIRNLF